MNTSCLPPFALRTGATRSALNTDGTTRSDRWQGVFHAATLHRTKDSTKRSDIRPARIDHGGTSLAKLAVAHREINAPIGDVDFDGVALFLQSDDACRRFR
jgi:hypothetical protein